MDYQKTCKQLITVFERILEHKGLKLAVHFELEGCYRATSYSHSLDYAAVNKRLERLGILGELKPEYWQNQWEYVSLFAGQSPRVEADNLNFILSHLDDILKPFGVTHTLIEPVVWNGDRGKMLAGSTSILDSLSRAVHIPNAIQMNVSILNLANENLLPSNGLGEWLQYTLLKNSHDNALLYLPCEAAFERLALKSQYGLSAELCSPVDISGGYQGSIALYKEKGKHNQLLGVKTLVVDKYNNTLRSEQAWQQQTRVEHRLGAASRRYCPYINVIFAYLCAFEALELFQAANRKESTSPNWQTKALPESLAQASLLFEQSEWLNDAIGRALSGYAKTAFNTNEPFENSAIMALSAFDFKDAYLTRIQMKQPELAHL